MAWADQRCIAGLTDCPAAHSEALPLLSHVVAAEHVWLARIEGRIAAIPVWPVLSPDECDRVATENAAGFATLMERTADEELAKLIQYCNQRGEEFLTPMIDILTHVVIHGAYHRGQIAKLIGRAGGKSLDTDFILFARDIEPGSSARRLN